MDAQYAETIVFRFIGYNLLGTAVRDATGMLGGLSLSAIRASDDIGTNMSKAGSAVAGVGSAMMLAGVLLAGGMIYAASKAAEFNSQMILLHTQARVSTDQLSALGTGVLQLAGQTGFGADALAKALYYIESVGGGSYTTAHALDELKAAAEGAAVGHSDLATTASVLASTMAVFPQYLPTQAMGELDAIVGQGKMTMEDLNGAMQTGILATLKSSGISLADFGGALATMTDYSIPATQAANALRMAIYLMDAPTAASNKVLKEFGLTTAEASTSSQAWTDALQRAGIRHAQLADDLRQPGGIIVAMEDLKKHFEAAGLSADAQAEVIYKAFGGGKMGKAMITLFDNIQGGAGASTQTLLNMGFTQEEIANLSDRLVTKTAAVNAQWNLLGQNFQFIQQNDPVQMWKDLQAGIGAAVIALGEAFIPLLVQVFNAVAPLVYQFLAWVSANQPLVRTIAIIAVSLLTLGGAALMFVGILGIVFGTIASIAALGIGATILPLIGIFLAVGLAIAAAAFLIITHWKQVQEWFKSPGIVAAIAEVKNAINFLWPIAKQAFDYIVKSIQPLIDMVLPQLQQAWQQLRPVLSQLILDLWDISKPFLVVAAIILGVLISGAFKALIGFLMGAIPTAIHFAVDVISLLGAILHLIADVFRNVAAIFDDIIHGNWNKMWKDAGKLLYDFSMDVVNIFAQLIITVVHLVEGLAVTIAATVWGLVKGVVDFFTWLYNKIVGQSIIPDLVLGILKWIVKLEVDFINYVSSLVNQAVGWFASLPGKILGAVGNLSGLLWGVGRSVVQGLINGFNSMAGNVVSAAKTVVSWIPGPIRQALRISSPSQLLAEQVGVPMAQGILFGFQSQQAPLKTGINSMITQVVRTADPRSGTGAPTGPATGESSADILKDIRDLLEEMNKPGSKPAAGVEALIYEITKRADISRNRGLKAYR